MSLTHRGERAIIVDSNNYSLGGDELINEAIRLLQSHHYRITKQRRSLLEYLSGFKDQYVSITQVTEHMKELYPGMSYNTVYRNLKDFSEIGIIETKTRPSGSCVKYQCDFGNLHHHHFICQACGKVQEVELCPVTLFDDQLAGCTLTGHRFELYGLCPECTQKRKNFTDI